MKPGASDLLAEGREAICTALAGLGEQTENPRLAALYVDLRDEVEHSTDASCLRPARANFAFRRADDYWRRKWDEVSSEPPPGYEEHVSAISAMYWSRRVAFEWRYPGKWQVALTL